MNILIFIALLQIKLFSIFQIRKLFYLIFFKIYWDDSSKFSKKWENKRYFHLECFVADNFVAGLCEENYLSLSLSLSFCLSLSLSPAYEVRTYMFRNRNYAKWE